MSDKTESGRLTNRRTFLRMTATGLLAIPAAALLRPAPAAAQDMPKLALDNPQAKALSYVHDAANVDKSKQPRYQEGQNCANCALFQAKGDEEWAGCSIFPGKLVNAAGWCSAYAPKA